METTIGTLMRGHCRWGICHRGLAELNCCDWTARRDALNDWTNGADILNSRNDSMDDLPDGMSER